MRGKRARIVARVLGLALLTPTALAAQEPAGKVVETLPTPRVYETTQDGQTSAVRVIDLPTALRLAGVYNPEIRLARERILEAVALRQFAAAQILPNINVGTNYDHHLGPLQLSNGELLKVHRDSLYVGLGASAVGAGTVNIPGIFWNANVSEVYFNALVRRQEVRRRAIESDAVRNDVLLRVAGGYLELLRANGRRALSQRIVEDANEVARVTANFAKTGQGRQADADRAATERQQRQAELIQAENEVQVASARLCQLLSLDPSIRLHPGEGQIVPSSLVPELIPLPELLTIALTQRPELRERQAAIRGTLLELQQAKVLPFSPQLAIGYSAGDFGGGSNLVAEGIRQGNGNILQQSRFGNFGDRQDLDVILFWTLRNLGVGNVAMIRAAESRVRQTRLTEVVVLDRIRAEVASAQARVQARFALIELSEKAIQSSQKAFQQDLVRTRNREGLPIEVLDSLRLLARSRLAYLDAIIDYNRAHFELYVALGQPPAATLARPVPATVMFPEPTLPPARK